MLHGAMIRDAENKSSVQITLLDTDGMATATASVSMEKVGMKRNISNISVDQSNVDIDGASTLQLAVYSGEHWETDHWSFLLSCCDSSQLADGAAVAIIFTNCAALLRILETGRCNAHIPTTLTGKTLEELAKGYKLLHLLNPSTIQNLSPNVQTYTTQSPRTARANRQNVRTAPTLQQHGRNLSPSVARFFQQTAAMPSLTSPQRQYQEISSPTTQFLNYNSN